uniref:Deoxycytidylate deaminase n=1 Tax=Eptatretus burgeri TaxID=7764 RepID=A0A8C4Q7V8_EPTBU
MNNLRKHDEKTSDNVQEQGIDDLPTARTNESATAGDGGKRTDYLQWSEYFMAVAFLSAQRSKDPSSQVGACIVNNENKIVGIGYNGMPNGCSDDLLPWRRSAPDRLDTKYPYVCHAEMNAILNKNCADVKGCSLYVALFPCNECAKLIIQSGICEVIYMSDKYATSLESVASRRLLSMAGVHLRKFVPQCRHIVIDFESINSSAGVEFDPKTSHGSAVTNVETVDPPEIVEQTG